MTLPYVARALASRWSLGTLGVAATVAGALWLGWRMVVVVLIVGPIAASILLLFSRDAAYEQRNEAIEREGRAIARASMLASELADCTMNACPLCAANRRAAELAAKAGVS